MNRVTIIFAILFLQLAAFGQRNHEELKEKMEARKVAFISEKLDLSVDEAQKFWPEYNMYIKEVDKLKSSMKDSHQQEKDIDDETANNLLNKSIEHEEKLLEIKKKYVSKLKQTIGPKKTLKFFHCERRFKQRLIEDVKHRRKKNSRRG